MATPNCRGLVFTAKDAGKSELCMRASPVGDEFCCPFSLIKKENSQRKTFKRITMRQNDRVPKKVKGIANGGKRGPSII
jgi:hypothetical protein